MDNFMDKIAQKLGTQDIIRANSAADAAQMEKLQAQSAEYDSCMKEIRKLNLKSMENEQKVQELIQNGSIQIQELIKNNSAEMQKLTEACIVKLQKNEKEEENTAKTEELFTQLNDYVHKENVKVYRNVQAALVEELKKQSETLLNAGQASAAKEKRLFTIGMITMIAAIANIGLLIVQILGIL